MTHPSSLRARPKANRSVPRWELRLGQYLYYSGRISRMSLLEALAWQRRRRPRFGEIASRCRLLDDRQIDEIIEARQRRERFGEAAIRTGHLTGAHRLAVLGRQRKLQPRIGQYFVDRGLLSSGEIDGAATDMREHNAKIAAAS